MSKIVCNRVKIAHVSDFEDSETGELIFKSGKSFTELLPIVSASYNFENSVEDAGILSKETVTVILNSTIAAPYFNNLSNYILQLYTDDSTFQVGSLNYPAVKTITSSKVRATFKFECSSAM